MSFRSKLALAMSLVAAVATGAALSVVQRHVAGTYAGLFEERFASEVELFSTLQETRLAAVKRQCLELASSVRLMAALAEDDPALLYRIALDELRDVLHPGPDGGGRAATFFRLVDGRGRVVPPTDTRAGLVGTSEAGEWEGQIGAVGAGLGAEWQAVGYLAPIVDGRRSLQEVVVTAIVDPVAGRPRGALAIGFPVADDGAAHIPSGIALEGRLYGGTLPASLEAAVARAVAGVPTDVVIDGVSHRVFAHALHAGAHFPPAHRVGFYSMADAEAEQRSLRHRMLLFGTLTILLGLGLSLVISHGLSVPVRALAAGTAEIGRGRLDVRVPVRGHDDLARLAASFNEMADGLELKERYRSVLDVVADPDVARELIEGRVGLGGELRLVSVLFCDVRGFTGLTERMPPTEIVELLNEHMTALMAVVRAHGGMIDKFVGDALVAVFGAPRSTGDDARRAVLAARDMVEERTRLNAVARRPLEVGIGIASGTVVAGCIGSASRLSYTVVGERVNLAARLCAQARPMEVLIDDETERLAPGTDVEPLPPLRLKGFSRTIAAYRLRRRAADAAS